MLAQIRLFHNFCTMVKERRTKYRRIISSSVVISYCLSTNQPKDDGTFRASTSIISCVRERTFYAISVVDLTMTDILKTQNPLQVCKTDKKSFVDAPYMYD